MQRKKGMPELVYWGLWGINSRGVALVFCWLCVVAGIVGTIYGFIDPRAFAGIGLFLAAGWYYYAIKWVDANSSWDD